MDAPHSAALEGAPDDAPPVRAGGRRPLLTPEESEFVRAREDLVDALPVAAAIICLGPDDEAFVDLSNERFRALAGPDGLAGGDGSSFVALSGIVPKILAFLRGGERVCEFDAGDGRPVGGRIFAVRLVRMLALPA